MTAEALNASEREELEQFRKIEKLSAAAMRSQAAELQRLIKSMEQCKPVGRMYQREEGASALFHEILPVGEYKLYTSRIALDFVTLAQVLKTLREQKKMIESLIRSPFEGMFGMKPDTREPEEGSMGWDLSQAIKGIEKILADNGIEIRDEFA